MIPVPANPLFDFFVRRKTRIAALKEGIGVLGGALSERRNDSMELIRKIVKGIDAVTEWTGFISSWTVLLLMFVIVFEVITRRLFNSPTVWTFDTSTQIYGFHFMLLAAYTLLHNKHISVDIVVMHFSSKLRAMVDLLAYAVFFFPFMIIIFHEGFLYARESWAIREVSYSVFAAPLYPIKTVIPVVAALLLLQGISQFIKRLYYVTKGREL
jgi:TRAP-type mannitol/chloroaromatic compound transport system permease small subunit